MSDDEESKQMMKDVLQGLLDRRRDVTFDEGEAREAMADAWRDYNAVQKERKESMREFNERLLRGSGLPWKQANGGAHWMLRGDRDVDAYPGTGRWRVGAKRRRGFKDLLRALGVEWRECLAVVKDGGQ